MPEANGQRLESARTSESQDVTETDVFRGPGAEERESLLCQDAAPVFLGTPGPWELDTDGLVVSKVRVPGVSIAMPLVFFDKRTHEANANLIAAAPEMLDVLLELQPIVHGLRIPGRQRIDAVIAKATAQAVRP